MGLEVGQILEGKVTGITKFGVFVSLPENKTGLVHISEIANTYVTDVREYLTDGQEVKVKVISIGEEGKISLSIKKAVENPPAAERFRAPKQESDRTRKPAAPPGPESFEDRLSKFMQDSKSNISGSKLYSEKKPRRRGGGGSGSGEE